MTPRAQNRDFIARISLAEIAVFLAGVILVWLLIGGVFDERWKVDFRYFWSAGRLWLDGVSPYSSDFIRFVEAEFGGDTAAFFYPPSILPIFALLGALPPQAAAYCFLAANLLFAGATALLAADLAIRTGAARTRWKAFAVLLTLLTIVFHPALSTLIYGQTSLLLAMAFSVYVRALESGRRGVAGLSLAILLMKPQFSIGLLIAALAKKEFRTAALIGLGVNAALFFLGALPDPAAIIRDFVANLSAYGDSKWNLSENSAGLGFLLSFLGLSLSPVVSLAAATAIALAATPSLANRPHNDERLALVMILIVAVSMAASANHSYDYVIFAPVAAFAFNARYARLRPLLAAAYAAMAFATPLALLLHPPSALGAAAGVHTAALLLIAAFAAFALRGDPSPPRAGAIVGRAALPPTATGSDG